MECGDWGLLFLLTFSFHSHTEPQGRRVRSPLVSTQHRSQMAHCQACLPLPAACYCYSPPLPPTTKKKNLLIADYPGVGRGNSRP